MDHKANIQSHCNNIKRLVKKLQDMLVDSHSYSVKSNLKLILEDVNDIEWNKDQIQRGKK